MITVDITWMVCDPGGLCLCVCVVNANAGGVYFGEFWVLMVHKSSECLTAGFCVCVWSCPTAAEEPGKV